MGFEFPQTCLHKNVSPTGWESRKPAHSETLLTACLKLGQELDSGGGTLGAESHSAVIIFNYNEILPI